MVFCAGNWLGVLRPVNVNWNGDGWNVDAYSVGNNRWNDDNLAFRVGLNITEDFGPLHLTAFAKGFSFKTHCRFYHFHCFLSNLFGF